LTCVPFFCNLGILIKKFTTMKTKYVCSHCNQNINVGEDIVLVAKNKDGKKSLVFLHTTLGNYTSKFNPDFAIKEGDLVKFLCPICHANLTNKKHNHLADFTMIDENEKKFNIVFSQIYGEKCTYKIEEQKVVESFGKHLERYQNPEWFLNK